ncbi:MAG: type II toxin-antitoxin system HipA family toxin [Chitinispirillaceae bacterium]|nr:type II toxin-antitoxin system HipA family toxin [Chitinispirillaceae bacterium]
MPAQVKRVKVAEIRLWNKPVGAVAWNDERQTADFEYESSFISSGMNIAPMTMPLRKGIFSFPALNRETFRGLPGLLADSLPDRFGNALIDLWLQQRGRSAADFTPVERLCYIGSRGMGALEYRPALTHESNRAVPLAVAELTALAREILAQRSDFRVDLHGGKAAALTTIIRVGTSAGGARAKAVIAWNPKTQEVRSGQVPVPAGFEPWILKFDGIDDKESGETKGFGRIEYAYHLMAVSAGIAMTECRLFEEGGRAHFMTRRFDRDQAGNKIHVQSLCALGHYDFNMPGAYSYEQAMAMIQKLNIGHDALREMFRRMAFNLIARNQDDHTRNIDFLMDQNGRWRLSPAFDVMWAYRSEGSWTSRHQMRVNGKQDDFKRDDLLAAAQQYGIKEGDSIIDKAGEAVGRWTSFAKEAGVPDRMSETIGKTHRLALAQ